MSTIYTPANAHHTSVTIPSDGDNATAASVNTPLEGIADNANWAYQRLIGSFLPLAVSAPGAINGNGWGSTTSYVTTIGSTPGPNTIFGNVPMAAGDIVVVQVCATVEMLNQAKMPGYMRIEYLEQYNGSSGTSVPDTQSEQQLATTAIQPTVFAGVCLVSSHQVLNAGRLGIFLNGHVTIAGGVDPNWQVIGGSAIYTVYRQLM